MVRVPKDRTRKQPVVGFCNNAKCRTAGKSEFEITDLDSDIKCPTCGANGGKMVGVKTLVHLLVPDPNGYIQGSGGTRFSLECDPQRGVIATKTNNEAASAVLQVVNCPTCISEAKARLEAHPEPVGDNLAQPTGV